MVGARERFVLAESGGGDGFAEDPLQRSGFPLRLTNRNPWLARRLAIRR
jgi:hypothetical protein